MCKKESRSGRARGHSASECEAGEPRSPNRPRGSQAMSPNGPPGRPERYLGPPRSGPAGAGRLSHIYKSVVFIAQHRRVIRPAEWAEGAAGTAAPRGPPSAPAADLLGVCGGGRRQGRRPSLRFGSVALRALCRDARLPVRPQHMHLRLCVRACPSLCVHIESSRKSSLYAHKEHSPCNYLLATVRVRVPIGEVIYPSHQCGGALFHLSCTPL